MSCQFFYLHSSLLLGFSFVAQFIFRSSPEGDSSHSLQDCGIFSFGIFWSISLAFHTFLYWWVHVETGCLFEGPQACTLFFWLPCTTENFAFSPSVCNAIDLLQHLILCQEWQIPTRKSKRKQNTHLTYQLSTY